MKKQLFLGIAGMLICLLSMNCTNPKPKTTIDCNLKVKDIVLADRTDTISFALGVAWGRGLGKYVGIDKISLTFYNGVQDYIAKDTALMGIYKANNYLNQVQPEIQKEALTAQMDSTISLCDIHLNTKFDTISYALGFAWCRGAYGIGISQISPALIPGLSQGIKGDTSLFSYRTADRYLQNYIEELRLIKYADIKMKNEKWLKDNGSKPDVKTTADGLQYKVIKSGNGKTPSGDDIVECNYIFKLIDGTVLENSFTKQETKKFYLFAVCKGLSEAVQLMKEGDRWEVYLPYQLAYGSGGIQDQVPPFGTVIYEVELIKVTSNR
jgi:FKBP-type peptidyl-prolyl cis-trans isomerase